MVEYQLQPLINQLELANNINHWLEQWWLINGWFYCLSNGEWLVHWCPIVGNRSVIDERFIITWGNPRILPSCYPSSDVHRPFSDVPGFKLNKLPGIHGTMNQSTAKLSCMAKRAANGRSDDCLVASAMRFRTSATGFWGARLKGQVSSTSDKRKMMVAG